MVGVLTKAVDKDFAQRYKDQGIKWAKRTKNEKDKALNKAENKLMKQLWNNIAVDLSWKKKILYRDRSANNPN
jgi:hypothetical protein